MRSMSFGSILIAVVSVAACGRTEPISSQAAREASGDGALGVYVLRTVAGQQLPAVGISHEHFRSVIHADTIWLHADGTGAAVSVERVTESEPPAERERSDVAPFRYSVSGSRFEADMPCNDVIILSACVAPPHYVGDFTSPGLRLTHALNYRVPMVFERVAGPSDVRSVRISEPDRTSVAVGSEARLTAFALDADGQSLAGRRARWHSLLPSVATVTEAGVLHGVAEGGTHISATIEGRADTVLVIVRK